MNANYCEHLMNLSLRDGVVVMDFGIKVVNGDDGQKLDLERSCRIVMAFEVFMQSFAVQQTFVNELQAKGIITRLERPIRSDGDLPAQ